MISSIVICFVWKSRRIPNSFMVLQPRMRSYTGLVILVLSYSMTSGVTVYSWLFEYLNNFKKTWFLPLVRKFPFNICNKRHLPSQVGKMHVRSLFMEPKITIRATVYHKKACFKYHRSICSSGLFLGAFSFFKCLNPQIWAKTLWNGLSLPPAASWYV